MPPFDRFHGLGWAQGPRIVHRAIIAVGEAVQSVTLNDDFTLSKSSFVYTLKFGSAPVPSGEETGGGAVGGSCGCPAWECTALSVPLTHTHSETGQYVRI